MMMMIFFPIWVLVQCTKMGTRSKIISKRGNSKDKDRTLSEGGYLVMDFHQIPCSCKMKTILGGWEDSVDLEDLEELVVLVAMVAD